MYIQKLFELMEEQTERREDYIRIMKEALEDEITCRLMKTPLQITIISILVKSGGKPPHERYSLFNQYCETVIKREKQKEIVTTLNDNTGWLEEIHYIIGDKLQCESEKEGNASAEISRENLEAVIRTYVEENQDDFYESESGAAKKAEEQNIISNIVDKLAYDEKENSYLSIIPLLIHDKIDLRNCMTERDMRKLEQIECVIDANILSMKLLRMCMAENDEPSKLIEEILAVNMPHKAIFMELENMLRYCRVENKEKIWVVVYQKLENEDFEGCQQIRNRIMNDMMEARCSAVTR